MKITEDHLREIIRDVLKTDAATPHQVISNAVDVIADYVMKRKEGMQEFLNKIKITAIKDCTLEIEKR